MIEYFLVSVAGMFVIAVQLVINGTADAVTEYLAQASLNDAL